MIDGEEDLQSEFNCLNELFKSLNTELGKKNNELSECNNQLILINERHAHYSHAIDILQSDEKQEEHKLREGIKQLQEELSQLHEQFNLKLYKQDDEIVRLQLEVQVLSDAAKSNTNLDLTKDETLEDVSFLENEAQEAFNDFHLKTKQVENLQKENRRLCESITNLRLELEQVKEGVECKKQELVEAYDVMNTLQEDVLISKMEQNSLENNLMQQENENSLYAEVNDRRLKLKETLFNLVEKCNKMKQEICKKQKQICTLRLHSDELQRLLKNNVLESEQDYKLLIDTYTSRISTLKCLFEDYEKLLREQEALVKDGLPHDTVVFLNNATKLQRKTEEKLNGAIGMECRAQKIMFMQLKEIRLKIQEWKTTTEQLQNTLLQCEESILLSKCQSSKPETNPKVEIYEENSDQDGSNKEVHESEGKFVGKYEKKNLLENTNTNTKKVTFATTTADCKSSGSKGIRKGGKILQCKTIYIPSLTKNS